MELRQLAYLVAVVEEGGFTAAAAREHVAQPGVSAQVRRLEAELGEPLLDRSGGSVTLTDAGAAVLPHARAALEAVERVRSGVDELRGLVRGTVAMGVLTTGGFPALPELLASFKSRHPGIEVTLEEHPSDQLADDLRTGRLDVALLGLAGDPPAGLETAVVADQPLVAAVAGGHELARRDAVTLRALSEHALIGLPAGTGARTAFDRACAATGIRPRMAFEAGDPRVLAQLAEHGLGVALLPGPTAAEGTTLTTLDITRPRIRSRVDLAWRNGPMAPAATAFLAEAREVLAPPGMVSAGQSGRARPDG